MAAKLNVYDRVRLEALDDRPEIRDEVEHLIQQHQELHASKTVLDGLFQFAGSYNIRDLATLKLHKITYNEKGEFPSIGKSRSGRTTKNMLVYLKNQEGKIDSYGWDTFAKHIQLFDFDWASIPKEVAKEGIDKVKKITQNKAIKDYLTSIDQVSPERIKDIQSTTERSKVVSLLGLEERINSIVEGTTQSLSSFLGNYDVNTVLDANFFNTINVGGSYLKQAQLLNLSKETQEAYTRLNDKNLIQTNEETINDIKLVKKETDKKIPHPAKLLIGDYLSDFTEIATKPTDKQKRFQQGIDLVHITKVVKRDEATITFNEADLIWQAFDVPYHRLKNFNETKEFSKEYTNDYKEGSRIAKELFIPEEQWISGNKQSPPTRSAFKDIPIIATYKTNGSETLRDIMKLEQHLFSTQEDEEQVALSRDMASTRTSMDNVVVLARIAKFLSEKGYNALSKDETTTKEVKQRFKNYAEGKKPIERFEQEYSVSITELINRIETIEKENNPNHSRLSQGFYPDKQYNITLPGVIRELEEAIHNNIYKEETINKIEEATYNNESVLKQLVTLQEWSEEDTDNYNRIKNIKAHPSVIENNLPWTATAPTTYISPENSKKLKGHEDLEAALDDVNAWEGMEDTIKKYRSLRNKHAKGYTLITQSGEGFVARKEFRETKAVYEKNIDDKVTIIDPEGREALQQEMQEMQDYEPLTEKTLKKAKALLSYDTEVNQKLQEKGIKHDTKTWGQLKDVWTKAEDKKKRDYKFMSEYLDNFYIEKSLVTTINNLYTQATK